MGHFLGNMLFNVLAVIAALVGVILTPLAMVFLISIVITNYKWPGTALAMWLVLFQPIGFLVEDIKRRN